MWNFGASREPISSRMRGSSQRRISSPWSGDSREQRNDHRFGFLAAAGELRVGRERVVAESNVVGQRAQDVRGLLGPARHADVDLADRAEAVACQKGGELVLQARG